MGIAIWGTEKCIVMFIKHKNTVRQRLTHGVLLAIDFLFDGGLSAGTGAAFRLAAAPRLSLSFRGTPRSHPVPGSPS